MLCWNQPALPRFGLTGFRIAAPKYGTLAFEYLGLKGSEKQQEQEGFSDLPLKQVIRPSVRGALPTPGRKEHPYLEEGVMPKGI